MTQKDWINKLKKEGYTEVRVVTILPGEDPTHTHDFETINVLLEGEITLFDETGKHIFRAGDRMETLAGATHRAINGPTVGKMVVGIKKPQE